MLKKSFDKLKTGGRVSVTGTQDGKEFFYEPGVIVDNAIYAYNNKDARCVRFDKWSEGHGEGAREWCFFDYGRRGFTIKKLPQALKPEPVEPKPRKRPHGPQEYKGNGKHEWETVTDSTVRLRVPGGWLYGKKVHSTVMSQTTFVPVPAAVGYAV